MLIFYFPLLSTINQYVYFLIPACLIHFIHVSLGLILIEFNRIVAVKLSAYHLVSINQLRGCAWSHNHATIQ
jgi:hypothetical protein